MNNNKTLLSICIPTFNRGNVVHSLLQFLKKELSSFESEGSIEVIISDNHSSDDTQERLISYQQEEPFFSYYRNNNNIGLIGNLLKLLELSKGEYLWFMGDDDIYHPGVVSAIYNELKKKDCSYLFINHYAYSDHVGDGTGYISAIPQIPNYTDKQSLLKIFDYSGPSLMFISANVYNRESLLSCDIVNHNNLALPLYFSFYCASKGHVTIIPEVLIENKWGDISWRGESRRIYYEYIPNILKCLPQLGYNKLLVKLTLLKYRIEKTILYQKIHYELYRLIKRRG